MESIKTYIDLGIEIAEKHKEYLMYLPFYEGDVQPEMKNNSPIDITDKSVKTHLVQQEKTKHLLELKTDKDTYWKAIENSITTKDIQALEKELNIILPKSYKYYLQYKHYYELFINIDIVLYSKPVNDWNTILIHNNREQEEYILEKGYLAIGIFSDYGTIALKLNDNEEIEGEIVVFYFDPIGSPEKSADNFTSLVSNILQEEQPRLVELNDKEKKMYKMK